MVTIAEYLAVDGQWHGPSDVEYRIYSLNDWLSSDDQFHAQGSPFDLTLSQNVFLSGDCEVEGFDLTIPEITIESTEDAVINPGVNLMLCLFNKATGRLLTVIAPRITIPPTPTDTDWPTLFARVEATLPANTANASVSGDLSVGGTVTADAFVGNGAGLTNLPVVQTFHGRNGPVTLQSSDLNGLSGAGLSGIGTGTGGVINTGTTTIGADSGTPDGVGVVSLETRDIQRIQIRNDGKVVFGRIGVDEVAISFAHLDSTAAFGLNTSHTDNAGVRNYVTNFGFNIGAVTDSTRDTLYVSFESRFKSGGAEYCEVNWEAKSSPDGIIRRFSSFNLDWLTGDQSWSYAGQFAITDRTNTISRVFLDDPVSGLANFQLTNTHLLLLTNNTQKIQQRNAADTDYEVLLFLDEDDIVQIAPGGVNVQIPGPTLIGAGTSVGQRLEIFGNVLIKNVSFGLMSRNTADDDNIVLVKLNASDDGEFMPGGENAVFGGQLAINGPLYVTDGTLKAVSFIADPADAAFKLLRVPA